MLASVLGVFRSPSRVPARRPSASGRCCRLGLALTLVLLLAGCATFQDNGPRVWRPQPQNGGSLISPPQVPDQTPGSPKPPPPGQQAGPNGCVDPDPLVIATCLAPVSAIAVLPDGQSAYVTQRATGRILQVMKGKQPKQIATVPVDNSNGGLIGLVLSPTFGEDQLLYAYIGSSTDHRVVRVTLDGSVTPILTGIPRTPGSDAGALALSKDGALIVSTGTDPGSSASDSLAGKILRINVFGEPMKNNPNPSSPVYSSGLQSPGGLCTSPQSGTVWATDRLPQQDVLYKIVPGQLREPVWNWPDRPGVAGCAATSGTMAIAEKGNSSLFVLQTDVKTEQFTGTPTTSLAGKYGRLSAAALGPDETVWLGTVNKGGGGPVTSSDDRVIRLPLIPGGANGSGPD